MNLKPCYQQDPHRWRILACAPGPQLRGQPRRPHGPTHWSATPRSRQRRYPPRAQDRPPRFATCPGPIDLLLRAVGHRGARGVIEPYAHGAQDCAPACRCRSRRRSAGADPWARRARWAGYGGEDDWLHFSLRAVAEAKVVGRTTTTPVGTYEFMESLVPRVERIQSGPRGQACAHSCPSVFSRPLVYKTLAGPLHWSCEQALCPSPKFSSLPGLYEANP